MKFILIVEHTLRPAEAFGPFDHKEDAEEFAREGSGFKIWRVAKLNEPKPKEK